jgi:hypothetical protein
VQGWLDAIFCSISPENPVAACTTQGIEIQSMLHDGRKKRESQFVSCHRMVSKFCWSTCTVLYISEQ